MPFLRFHSTDSVKLSEVSRKMTDAIQQVLNCPREHIVLEIIPSEIVCDGTIGCGDWPFVEISYFERSPELQDRVARIVSDCLKEVGYSDSDVYFLYLNGRNYYENGLPLSRE